VLGFESLVYSEWSLLAEIDRRYALLVVVGVFLCQLAAGLETKGVDEKVSSWFKKRKDRYEWE